MQSALKQIKEQSYRIVSPHDQMKIRDTLTSLYSNRMTEQHEGIIITHSKMTNKQCNQVTAIAYDKLA